MITPMTKVLLIDDDVELVALLKEYLEGEEYEVTAVHNGEDGAAAALSGDYAIAVLDVMMPRLNGVETLRRIRMKSNMPVLMLTARGDDTDRIVGLELGADDYVPKPCTPRELSARIRAILRRTQGEGSREAAASSTQLDAGELTMWPAQRRAQWQGKPLELTSTEFNLLEILAKNTGRPVTKPELSEQALGRPLARFDRSIDVHLSAIRHKLGTLPDGRSYIQTVRRLGYQLIVE
ncbi:MAG: response regulator transcription factor [Betaproteobacteria bacterium]|nr:response regulator transcription factor [Betaproteobacteria bacterium]